MSQEHLDTQNLQRIPLFKTLSGNNLRKLAGTMQRVHFKAGEIICYEGDRGDSFYTILGGEAEIIKSLATPEEQLLVIYGPGDFIGEMALFEPDGVRLATVRAKGEVDAFEMTREVFNDLIHNSPDLAFEVSRVLTNRVQAANTRLQEKNERLEKTLVELRAAQAELIDKERMERELELARTIQHDILPKEFPTPDLFSLGAQMKAAREVGGDFFDFISLSNHRIGVLIGDVSDKGVPAAIFMALTRSLIHAEARRSASPITVLTRVNQLLAEMSEAAMFVTALYGILDCKTGLFEYARAGHELPIIVDDENHEHIPPKTTGQPLAMFDDPVFDTQTLVLKPGMTLVLYTDGATDSTSLNEEFYGLDRLTKNLINNSRVNAQDLVDDLVNSIMEHQQGSKQYDDITMLAIHANPRPDSSD